MKRFLLLVLLSIAASASAQEVKYESIIFCNKTLDESSRGSCTVSELRNCDLKIYPVDTSLRVISFVLTIVPRANPQGIKAVKLTARRIPAEYLEELCGAKIFRIENIELNDSEGNLKEVLPIVISVWP